MTPAGPVRVLLLGGTSEIGLSILRAMALGPGDEVVLAGRDEEALRAAGAGLPCRVRTLVFDATRPETHADVVAAAGPDLDVVVSAAGVLLPRPELDLPGERAALMVQTNLTGHVCVLLEAARVMRARGRGTIVVLSSIAAVRPRRSTLVYGAAKAGLDAFARGLADALHGSGVDVLVVRPGFVRGRMTQGLAPAPWSTTPEAVGQAVAARLRQDGPSRGVLFVPQGLRVAAAVMRLVPRPIWRRLDL